MAGPDRCSPPRQAVHDGAGLLTGRCWNAMTPLPRRLLTVLATLLVAAVASACAAETRTAQIEVVPEVLTLPGETVTRFHYLPGGPSDSRLPDQNWADLYMPAGNHA